MTKGICRFLIVAIVAMTMACEKEYSFESGGFIPLPEGDATGTLAGSPAACATIQVSGIYGQGLALDSGNRANVELNITRAGQYTISTDTVNGFYFSATGVASATGILRVDLRGTGIPATVGPSTFTVKFGASSCSFVVDILPVAPAPGTDYFPMTTGSNWRYTTNVPGGTDTALQVSTGLTVTGGGNTYNLFSFGVAPNNDTSVYRKSGNDYFQFGDIDVAGIASNFVFGEYIFLKDNVNAGTTWESAQGDAIIASDTVKIKLVFNLIARDVKEVLGNVVYNNVIKVRLTQQRLVAGSFQSVLSYETWYARGIGLLNVVVPAPVYGYRLTRYQVL